jgi:hypothetical protein
MVFNRKHQTGLVFLTNSEPGVINDMVFEFLDLYRDYRRDRDRAAARMATRVGAQGPGSQTLVAPVGGL